MSDNNGLKKFEIKSDELERRVNALEKSVFKKKGISEFEEAQNLCVATNPVKKYYLLNAVEDGCVSLILSMGKDSQKEIRYAVSCGEWKIEKRDAIPFSKEIAVPLKAGKNLICIEIEFVKFDETERFSISAKFKGNADNQLIEPFFDYLNEKYAVIFAGDTLSFYNVCNYEVDLSLTGIEKCSVGARYDEISLLYKSVGGEFRLAKYDPDTLRIISDEIFKNGFSECAVSYDEDIVEYYLIKSNAVYCQIVKGEQETFFKSPIKAKKIWCYNGKNKRYLYYIDLNDNYVVIEKEYLTSTTLKKYALGKLKKVRLFEDENEKPFALYKHGEGIAKMDVNDGVTDYVAVGDECLVYNGDIILVRRGNEIFKGE